MFPTRAFAALYTLETSSVKIAAEKSAFPMRVKPFLIRHMSRLEEEEESFRTGLPEELKSSREMVPPLSALFVLTL